MIAQTLASHHPDMVRSLVSIMSNTGRITAGQPRPRVYPVLLRRPPEDREAFVAHIERVFAAIGSRGIPQDIGDIRELIALSYERDRDPTGMGRQLAAIIASGDRTADVRRIKAPTLVVHGTADPLVAPSGGRATARAIKGAKLLKITGMGHDMPRAIWARMIDAILENASRAQAPEPQAASAPPAHGAASPASA